MAILDHGCGLNSLGGTSVVNDASTVSDKTLKQILNTCLIRCKNFKYPFVSEPDASKRSVGFENLETTRSRRCKCDIKFERLICSNDAIEYMCTLKAVYSALINAKSHPKFIYCC